MTLIAEYGFTEGSGTTTADSSGNGRDLTVTAGNWTGAGHTGSALQSSGSSAAQGLPFNASMTAFTVMCWMKLNSVGAWQSLVEWSFVSTPNLFLEVSPAGALDVFVRGSSGQSEADGSALTVGTWYHVAARVSAAGVALVVDGSEVASTTTNCGTFAWSTETVYVCGSPGGPGDMDLDDLRFYDTALTDAEIATLMGTPVGGGGSNVDLTGETVVVTAGAPAGSLSLSSVTDVTLTGEVVGVVGSAPTGVLELTTNIDDAGAPAGVTTAAPAGSLTLSSDYSATGLPVGLTAAAPAGTVSTSSSSSVDLTGQPAGVVTGAPAGTVDASSSSTDVALVGVPAQVVLAAPAGVLTITSVGDVSLVGQPVGVTTAAPAGSVNVSSTLDVSLVGQPVALTLTAPPGSVDLRSDVTLTGEVTGASLAALAGSLDLVSLAQLVGAAVGVTAGAPAGSLGLDLDLRDLNLTAALSPDRYLGVLSSGARYGLELDA